MLNKRDDPAHEQKAIYSLTEPSIELVLIMAALGAWGRKWLPVSEELSIRARVLEEGDPELRDRFMAELRQKHLGIPASPAVRQRLQDAYLAVVASNSAV